METSGWKILVLLQSERISEFRLNRITTTLPDRREGFNLFGSGNLFLARERVEGGRKLNDRGRKFSATLMRERSASLPLRCPDQLLIEYGARKCVH